MPIEADPNQTFEVVLAQHRELPKSEQPKLLFRFPKRRDSRRLSKVISLSEDLMRDGGTISEQDAVIDEYVEAIKSLLVGWSNQTDEAGKPLPFDPDDFDRVVSDDDLGELAAALRTQPSLLALDKKKSVSRSGYSSDAVAKAAERLGDVLTPQQSNAPSESSAPSAKG